MLREERNNRPPLPSKKKTHRDRRKDRKKVCCGSQRRRRKKNRERLRLRHPPGLPPPSWKHRVRALALHVLIMINAGTTTHTETTVLAGFWPGSLLGPAVLHAAVNTLVWIVKVPVHKPGKFWRTVQLRGSHRMVRRRTVH